MRMGGEISEVMAFYIPVKIFSLLPTYNSEIVEENGIPREI